MNDDLAGPELTRGVVSGVLEFDYRLATVAWGLSSGRSARSGLRAADLPTATGAKNGRGGWRSSTRPYGAWVENFTSEEGSDGVPWTALGRPGCDIGAKQPAFPRGERRNLGHSGGRRQG